MMNVLRKLWGLRRNGAQEPESDAWVQKTLASLDPSQRHPRYWFEFHRGVMLSAGAELARRRRAAEVTVSDVVFSWSRALVPAAVVASLAAFFALRSASVETPVPIRLEEILWEGAGVSPGEVSDRLSVEVSFAVDVY
jgi:hypothetical protein